MTEKLKEKYLHLYETANKISRFKPWDYFDEADRFMYIGEDESNQIFFSFINESAGKCGIACYIGVEDYLRARLRLTEKNIKNEPVFMLQNALICLWDNRPDLSEESYELIKELGFKPRGNGAWLHFDRYEIGYVPVPLDENEIELLTDALENLYIMLATIYKNSLNPEFDKEKTLVRQYEPEDKKYHTYLYELDMPTGAILLDVATVHENAMMRKIRSMSKEDYTAELDWSYANIVFVDEDDRKTFPKLLCSVDPKNGHILHNEMISPNYVCPEAVLNALTDIVERYGKPSKILICDEELKAILSDFCNKIDLELVVAEELKALNSIRKDILSYFEQLV